MTEKQNRVKIGTKSPERKHLPYIESVVALKRKRKGCPCEVDMNRLDLHKSSNCTKAEKIVSFENRSQQQQLIFSIYQSPEPLVKFLANACLQPEVSAQLSRK